MTNFFQRGMAHLRFGAIAALCMFGAILSTSGAATAASPSLQAIGERLYTSGIDVSGKPVAAIDMSGQRVYAPQFHCIACHRASGYGSREGGVIIPPIPGPILFQPRRPDRTRAFNSMYFQPQTTENAGRLYQARTRPAYDRASLSRVLRDGIDADGQRLTASMPRFVLTKKDVEALEAYLRTLSATPDPGVDAKTMHMAIILSDKVPAKTRQMLIDTSRVFVERYNKNVGSERARPNFSPMYRSEFVSFWREWSLDIWDLKGPEASWPSQLEAYYKAQPAFAVIGGAVEAPWQPVGDFCDQKRLPCLFPLTDMPARQARDGGYTVYNYGGLPLEARALAAHLSKAAQRPRSIVELVSQDAGGILPADEFRSAMAVVAPETDIRSVSVKEGNWRAALASALSSRQAPDTLVLWPGSEAEGAVKALLEAAPALGRAYLPSAAEAAAKQYLTGTPTADKIRLLRPTELASVVNPHSYRVRSWLYARRVAVDPPEDQFQVYYALSVIEKAVMEIQGDYFRDYLLEQIEMIAESNLNPGVFPTLSLGPGQRIASRGSYVVRLDASAPGGVVADGEWLVP